ncbi:DUF488 family protein [Candidatus Micrarchaeota archaeon]|nr:DUF488 family protein [Candidatus Micrarchaeota archaeon]
MAYHGEGFFANPPPSRERPLLRRQRVLLSLASLLSQRGRVSRTFLDKLLFLLKEEYSLDEHMPFYSFYPYNYGPFSQLFYYDLRKLKDAGCLLGERVTPLGVEKGQEIDAGVTEAVEDVVNRFATEEEAVKYVYSKYPEYTVKSKLLDSAAARVEPGFFTIGYEGKNIDSFLNILIQNKITVLADVRYNAFSMNFAFTESKLVEYLSKVGIRYVHFKYLGIPGEKRKELDSPQAYEELFDEYSRTILPANMAHFKRLEELGRKERVALLCFEKDATFCHRGVIAHKLEGAGFEVGNL